MAKVLLYFSVTNVIIFIFICIHYQALATLDCNFDDDMCGWQQDRSDDFDWQLESGYTPSSSTGPSSDHTTGDGYYIYVKASDEKEGDEAILISPLQERGQFCLTLWYSMYGRDMGTLNVYMKLKGGSETLILTKDKNLGNRNWRKAVISQNAIDSYQIVLEGVRGDGSKSDIAVDDISIIPGLCSVDCDYDNGLCNWMQDDDDNFDWTLRKGPTPTSDTGPDADHTSGNGQYVYIDSSSKSRNDIAWLVSPLQNAGKYCFSFWYYMYGEGVDRLMVEQLYPNGTTQNMFTKNGNKGQIWHREQLLLHSTTYFKIFFEGRVKDAGWRIRYKGDIAIDDVTMMSCQDCDIPRTNNSVVNSTNFEYGSVIEITCNEGYSLNGESRMVCQAGGSWSVSQPTCKLFGKDCGDRTIPNGTFNAQEGTTFGQTATHVCNDGYTLVGDATVSCTATGWNSTNTTCEIFDCGNRTIPNGKFIAKHGTTFEQTASQICNKGYYILIGDTDVTCTSTGWDGAVATCIIVDCGDPTPKYATPNTTYFKYGSVVEVACNTGYNLTGQSHVVCQADGSWIPRPPICKPYETKASYLIAVYITVPLTVIILAILITLIICRKWPIKYSQAVGVQHEENGNSVIQVPTETVEAVNDYERLNSSLQQYPSNEYAVLSDNQNDKGIHVYYNTAESTFTDE